MADDLLFLDSFHHHLDESNRKWTLGNFSTIAGGRAARGGQIGTFATTGHVLATEHLTVCAGVAYKTPAFANSPLYFWNQYTNSWAQLSHLGDGRFRFYCSAGAQNAYGTELSPPMHIGRWYYLEFKCVMAITPVGGGLCDVSLTNTMWANEEQWFTEVLTFEDLTYQPFQDHPGFAALLLVGPGGGHQATFADLYWTQGERLGDGEIHPLYPNAAGDLTEWTPSAGANYENVDENPDIDDDSTYNKVGAAGLPKTDLYNLDNIAGFSGTIKGAQACACLKKSNVGFAYGRFVWKSGVTTYNGGHYFYPSFIDWRFDLETKRKSPFTSLDFTVAELNAMQLGYQRNA
jgi:hypothetical protein